MGLWRQDGEWGWGGGGSVFSLASIETLCLLVEREREMPVDQHGVEWMWARGDRMESGVGRWGAECLLPRLHRNLVLASGERETPVDQHGVVWSGCGPVETGWRVGWGGGGSVFSLTSTETLC